MYLDKDPTGTNATYALAKAKAIQHDLGNKNVDDTTACKPATKPEPLPRPKADPLPNNTEVTGTKNLGVTESAGGGGGGGGGGLKYVGIGIAGAGVVTLGVGVFFGLKAKQKSDFISNYTEEHPGMAWPEDVNQIEKDGQTYEDRQIRLMIGGGVLAVAGAIVYVIGASKGSKTEKLSVKPTATPSSIGVSLGRGF